MSSMWTHVGAACVADESSAGKYEAAAARFRHKGSNIGEIYAKCNVVNLQDHGPTPEWNCLEVVYSCQADTDWVTAELMRVTNETGGQYPVALFESNRRDLDRSPDEQTNHAVFHHNFDFEHSAYYVLVTVHRGSWDAGHNPSVSIVRLKKIPEILDWQIRLDRLRVEEQNEGWDEPYFVMLGFRSTFDTPGSTHVFGHLHTDDDWAEGSVAGDEHDIPRAMGVLTFPEVHYVSTLELMDWTKPEVIGALAIAFESDTTPWGVMTDTIDYLKTLLEREMRRLIEEQPITAYSNPDGINENIEKAVKGIKESVQFGTLEAIRIAVASYFDIDEVIGYHLFAFIPVDPWQDPEFPDDEVKKGMHIGALLERQFTRSRDNAIHFAGEGAVYLVNAAVDALPPE